MPSRLPGSEHLDEAFHISLVVGGEAPVVGVPVYDAIRGSLLEHFDQQFFDDIWAIVSPALLAKQAAEDVVARVDAALENPGGDFSEAGLRKRALLALEPFHAKLTEIESRASRAGELSKQLRAGVLKTTDARGSQRAESIRRSLESMTPEQRDSYLLGLTGPATEGDGDAQEVLRAVIDGDPVWRSLFLPRDFNSFRDVFLGAINPDVSTRLVWIGWAAGVAEMAISQVRAFVDDSMLISNRLTRRYRIMAGVGDLGIDPTTGISRARVLPAEANADGSMTFTQSNR